ncbi:MAG: DUF1292 domain-containing protein [Oscillospiraceae bacterium]|nr:DUF1292 domain-containing protein [Oscillospiraceae bacterium]
MEKNVIFTLEDDLGNEVEFELLDVITYKNEEYAVLVENVPDVKDFTILKIDSIDDQEEVYVGIDDEALVQKIFDIFKKNHPDDFNYAD